MVPCPAIRWQLAMPWFGLAMLFPLGVASTGIAQIASSEEPTQSAPTPSLPPIAELPMSIDPAELLDKRLSMAASVQFEETSLSDVAMWVQKTTGLNVVLDQRSLDKIGLLPSEPVTDSLKEEPIYLLLDRLGRIGIGWKLVDGMLYFHASQDKSAVITVQYNIGDLLDQKFKPEELKDAIVSIVDPDTWNSDEVEGAAVLLGDVLFVRQVSRTHRRVAGLLAALRKPARRVIVDDPPSHAPIRQALDRPTSVELKGKSLAAAVDEIAKSSSSDIRIDRIALKGARISDRVPVNLEIRDQKLRTVLDILVSQMRLAWTLRDGVLWITTTEVAEQSAKIAVFDVRDLCRNMQECDSLQEAIQQQSDPESWESSGGKGIVAFASSGIMTVSQTEDRLDAVLTLLDNYRLALRNSKRRISPEEDPESFETKYYRMPTAVADDLEKMLPALLFPETWSTLAQPNAKGSIRKIKSWDQVSSSRTTGPGSEPQVVQSFSVLIIEQKRKVHAKIPEILSRIERGDALTPSGMSGMGGMGGFGGGLFRIPNE